MGSRRRGLLALAGVLASAGCNARGCGPSAGSMTSTGAPDGAGPRAMADAHAPPPDHAFPVANLTVYGRFAHDEMSGSDAGPFSADTATGLVEVGGKPLLVGRKSERWLGADGPLGPPIPLAQGWPVLFCEEYFGTDGDRLYGAGRFTELYSFDAHTGALSWLYKWDIPADAGPRNRALYAIRADVREPHLVDGTVVYERDDGTAEGHGVDGFDARSMTERWFRPHAHEPRTNATTVLVRDLPHHGAEMLTALDPRTGAVRWSREPPKDSTVAALDDTHLVLVQRARSDFDDPSPQTLLVLDPATGITRTTIELAPARRSNFQLLRGELYALGTDTLARLDLDGGRVMWQVDGHFDHLARGRDALFATDPPKLPAHADRYRGEPDTLTLVPVEDGLLYTLDPATGARSGWSYGMADVQSITMMETDFGELVAVFSAAPDASPFASPRSATLFHRTATPAPVRKKTVDITLVAAEHPEKLAVVVDGQLLHFDAAGHWRGELEGRGQHLVKADPDFAEEDRPPDATIDFDAPGDTVALTLTISHYHQACAVE